MGPHIFRVEFWGLFLSKLPSIWRVTTGNCFKIMSTMPYHVCRFKCQGFLTLFTLRLQEFVGDFVYIGNPKGIHCFGVEEQLLTVRFSSSIVSLFRSTVVTQGNHRAWSSWFSHCTLLIRTIYTIFGSYFTQRSTSVDSSFVLISVKERSIFGSFSVNQICFFGIVSMIL